MVLLQSNDISNSYDFNESENSIKKMRNPLFEKIWSYKDSSITRPNKIIRYKQDLFVPTDSSIIILDFSKGTLIDEIRDVDLRDSGDDLITRCWRYDHNKNPYLFFGLKSGRKAVTINPLTYEILGEYN